MGDLIRDFIRENPCDNYVILDDINDMTKEQQPHLVHTTFEHGFTDQDLEKAINILNK